ncbi:MAG: hypothetical protein K6G03_12340 [Lachnospiraceae bacterium]|nr:hypothetical protein [Lachnospiraceae bacterium]
MKNQMVKKLMMAALTGVLCVGMAMAAYAAPAGGPGGQMGQGPQSGQMGQGPKGGQMGQAPQGGQMGQLPQGEAPTGERPELPEGVEEGELPELPEGVEEGERPELPEGVSDNGTAPDGTRPPMDGERPEGERPEGALPEGAVNVETYKSALEAVEDDDTKSSLQEYIDALEEALEAEKSAMDSDDELTDDEMEAYRTAVEEATEALKAAFEDAGVEIEDIMPEPNEDEIPEGAAANKPLDNDQKANVSADSAVKNSAKTAAQPATTTTEKTSENKNIFTNKLSEIYNWLKGIFG